MFLSAEWRDLVMLNYQVSPDLLTGYLPRGTELDFFNGVTFVSLVGFCFLGTRIFGSCAVPFHSSFDEVNLRFYVRRRFGSEWRRGVVFVREIVPRRLIALIARLAYSENYIYCPMRHRISCEVGRKIAEYGWRFNGRWSRLSATVEGLPSYPLKGSLEEFITEHYWGYSAASSSRSVEYRVSHAPWRVWGSESARFEGDGIEIYGNRLGQIVNGIPDSALIAEG